MSSRIDEEGIIPWLVIFYDLKVGANCCRGWNVELSLKSIESLQLDTLAF